MAEMRVVVQLDEQEYQTLLRDLTEVFDGETDRGLRDRKLRMLLQHRGYVTSAYDGDWKVGESTSVDRAAPKAAGRRASTKKKPVTRAK